MKRLLALPLVGAALLFGGWAPGGDPVCVPDGDGGYDEVIQTEEEFADTPGAIWPVPPGGCQHRPEEPEEPEEPEPPVEEPEPPAPPVEPTPPAPTPPAVPAPEVPEPVEPEVPEVPEPSQPEVDQPVKEDVTPEREPEPSVKSVKGSDRVNEISSPPAAATAESLPFTGLNARLVASLGFLLFGLGLIVRAVVLRHR